MSPATTCLDLVIGDQEEEDGGCVNPVIRGHNGCADALAFSAGVAEDGEDHIFEPGEAVEIEIDIENRDVATEEEDGFRWNVPAQLGDQAIEVRFVTWLP